MEKNRQTINFYLSLNDINFTHYNRYKQAVSITLLSVGVVMGFFWVELTRENEEDIIKQLENFLHSK